MCIDRISCFLCPSIQSHCVALDTPDVRRSVFRPISSHIAVRPAINLPFSLRCSYPRQKTARLTVHSPPLLVSRGAKLYIYLLVPTHLLVPSSFLSFISFLFIYMIPVLALACILLGATTRISIEAFIGRIYIPTNFFCLGG